MRNWSMYYLLDQEIPEIEDLLDHTDLYASAYFDGNIKAEDVPEDIAINMQLDLMEAIMIGKVSEGKIVFDDDYGQDYQ